MADTYPIKKIHIVDILPVAVMFDDCFSKHLIPPPSGIYVRNEIKPRMVPDQHYRQMVISDSPIGETAKAEVPLTYLDLEMIESAVYNEVGECVIARRHVPLLSNTPNLPAVAISLIYELMDNRLAALQVWPASGGRPPARRDYDILLKYLNAPTQAAIQQEYGDFDDEQHATILVDLLEDMLACLAGVFQKMVSFVDGDVWTVHFMEFLEPLSVKLSKSVDYRIANWHLLTGTDIDY